MCPAPNAYLIPLSEAVHGEPLPLPREIVTTDVSQCGNGGAIRICQGGWEGNKEREK